ncbi:MAG TPA: hypothetical protein PLD23_21515 [Armatimonadota bacterium]|nr:hypothetical protein [Armatimonadota bacterium]
MRTKAPVALLTLIAALHPVASLAGGGSSLWTASSAAGFRERLGGIALAPDAQAVADVLVAAGSAGLPIVADASLCDVRLDDLGVAAGASCAVVLEALYASERGLLYFDHGILAVTPRVKARWQSVRPPSAPPDRQCARALRRLLERLPDESQQALARRLPVSLASAGGAPFFEAYDDLGGLPPGERLKQIRARRGSAEPRVGMMLVPLVTIWPKGSPDRAQDVCLVPPTLWGACIEACQLPPDRLAEAAAVPVDATLAAWWDAHPAAPPAQPDPAVAERSLVVSELCKHDLRGFCRWISAQAIPCTADVGAPSDNSIMVGPGTYSVEALLEIAACQFEVHLSWTEEGARYEAARAELPRCLLAQWYCTPEYAAIPFTLEEILEARYLAPGALTGPQREYIRAARDAYGHGPALRHGDALPDANADWGGLELRLRPMVAQMRYEGRCFEELDDPAERVWKAGGSSEVSVWPLT